MSKLKNKTKNNEFNLSFVANETLPSRQETLDGEDYIVYPVVMLKEGVLNGLLYTENEIKKFSQTWNGVPVPIQHPKINGNYVSANDPQVFDQYVVGTVFNTVFEDGKLKAEIWLKNSKLNDLAPEVSKILTNGEPLDVSTGLFSEDIVQEGIWEGQEYSGVVTNIRPDHLALLPGVSGACSWEDGCGVRANDKKNKNNKNNSNKNGGKHMKKNKRENGENGIKLPKDFKKNIDQYLVLEDYADPELITNALSKGKTDYLELVDEVRETLNQLDNNKKYHYPVKIYKKELIYRVNYYDTPGKTSAYFTQEYTIDDNGNVVLTGNPEEVIKQVLFKSLKNNDNQGKGGDNGVDNLAANAGTNKTKQKTRKNRRNNMPKKTQIKTMAECCPDKVDELIKANSNFTEEDKETLLGLTEDAFALVINVAKPIEDNKDDQDAQDQVTTNAQDTTGTQDTEKGLTFDEILANASPEAKESIEYGQRVLARHKEGLITKIKANEANKFTDEDLSGFGLDMLEKIAGSLPAKAPTYQGDFSMMNPVPTVTANQEDVPVLPDPETYETK